MSASGCTMLTTHLKYGSLRFMFKTVANDMPWKYRNLFPLKKRFVPSMKLGPGDLHVRTNERTNLLFHNSGHTCDIELMLQKIQYDMASTKLR